MDLLEDTLTLMVKRMQKQYTLLTFKLGIVGKFPPPAGAS